METTPDLSKSNSDCKKESSHTKPVTSSSERKEKELKLDRKIGKSRTMDSSKVKNLFFVFWVFGGHT